MTPGLRLENLDLLSFVAKENGQVPFKEAEPAVFQCHMTKGLAEL